MNPANPKPSKTINGRKSSQTWCSSSYNARSSSTQLYRPVELLQVNHTVASGLGWVSAICKHLISGGVTSGQDSTYMPPAHAIVSKAVQTLGSKLLNQSVTATLGDLLLVAPEIIKFLLHLTSNQVEALIKEFGSALTTHPSTWIFDQEDIVYNSVAVH